MNFSAANIIAGVVFGTFGMASLSYGRKLERWKPQTIGILLMSYSWFVSNTALNWLIGASLVVLLWFHHDE
ncbi:MAG: hypothetical protein V4733_00505 [Verrucomicrobiota bacterium]